MIANSTGVTCTTMQALIGKNSSLGRDMLNSLRSYPDALGDWGRKAYMFVAAMVWQYRCALRERDPDWTSKNMHHFAAVKQVRWVEIDELMMHGRLCAGRDAKDWDVITSRSLVAAFPGVRLRNTTLTASQPKAKNIAGVGSPEDAPTAHITTVCLS